MKTHVRVTAYPRTIRTFCQEALKHHLHRGHGMMVDWMQDPESIRAIAIVYNASGSPVGAAILLHDRCDVSYVHIGVYVKTAHRRKGAGKAVVERLLAHCRVSKREKAKLCTWTESPQAAGFYNTLGFTN